MDDFKDHPPSVTELRAHREDRADIWTPRDALIETLRLIDAGQISPSALIVVYQKRSDNAVGAFMACAVPDKHTAMGMLMAAIRIIEE